MRAFLSHIRVHFIVALLALSVLSGCLKSNGEPYPGTASENNDSGNTGGNLGNPVDGDDEGGGVKIDFPPGSIDEVIRCEAEAVSGAKVVANLGINSSKQLTLKASLETILGEIANIELLAEAAAVSENHSDAMRSYLSSNVRLYIQKDRNISNFPDTLKYKVAGSSLWIKLNLKCNSTGYSEDIPE